MDSGAKNTYIHPTNRPSNYEPPSLPTAYSIACSRISASYTPDTPTLQLNMKYNTP